MKPKYLLSLLLPCVVLAQCANQEPVNNEQEVSGAKSALFGLVGTSEEMMKAARPSVTMGIFTSMYLAQGVFLPVRTAVLGMEAQRQILAAQSDPRTGETFALLQELGNILQVNIIDVLNRSDDRETSLNEYIDALHSVGMIAQQKATELEALLEQMQDQRREKRNAVRDIEREASQAIRDDNYAIAGQKQQELTKAKSELAEIESKEEQTDDILDRYRDLLEVAETRLVALEANREILVAGLKVTDVEGAEDLGIIQEPERRNRRDSIFSL